MFTQEVEVQIKYCGIHRIPSLQKMKSPLLLLIPHRLIF